MIFTTNSQKALREVTISLRLTNSVMTVGQWMRYGRLKDSRFHANPASAQFVNEILVERASLLGRRR